MIDEAMSAQRKRLPVDRVGFSAKVVSIGLKCLETSEDAGWGSFFADVDGWVSIVADFFIGLWIRLDVYVALIKNEIEIDSDCL